MENIEKILPVTKADSKEILKTHKPIIIGVIITLTVFLIGLLFVFFSTNDILIRIIFVSFYIFMLSALFVFYLKIFYLPFQKDKKIGKKQLTGIITDKLEKRSKYKSTSDISGQNMTYYIVLGGKEEIRIDYKNYMKLKVNQKIKIVYLENSKFVFNIENLSEND